MDDQREFFDSRAEGWEDKCYPPDVRTRLAELVPEFEVRPRSPRPRRGHRGPECSNPYPRRRREKAPSWPSISRPT